MLKQKLFTEQFVLVTIIAILHFLALQFYLYWIFWWFDIVTHFLGGLWVGLVVLWFFLSADRHGFFSRFVYKNVNIIKQSKIFLITIISVIIVGILWEIWELLAKLVFVTDYGYFLDTSLDIVMDTLGGITAFIYAKISGKGLSSRKRSFLEEERSDGRGATLENETLRRDLKK
jgi:hypothetical protein